MIPDEPCIPCSIYYQPSLNGKCDARFGTKYARTTSQQESTTVHGYLVLSALDVLVSMFVADLADVPFVVGHWF